MKSRLSMAAGEWRQRWIPSIPVAGLLAVLALGVVALRKGVVTGKKLAEAREQWQAAYSNAVGPPFKWDDAAVLGTHYSSLAALAILAVAFLTMRWWCVSKNPHAVGSATARSAAGSAPQRWFWGALAGIVLVAGALRLPLAGGSLWWDELWNVKYATVGEWRQDPANPDETRFVSTSWTRAAWYYNKPTNHAVVTLPSKAAHLLWQKITRPEDPGKFKEWVLRLPVLLGSLTALVLTALLARRWAGEGAGLLAGTLMAIHPWVIRYSADARSYGLSIAFVALALFSLHLATAADTRRRNAWWWVFGACQFFLMWSHLLGHVALCSLLFLAAALLIWRNRHPLRLRELGQLVVINFIAAGLLLVAVLPNLLQAATWGELNGDGNLLTFQYMIHTLSQVTAGMEPPPHPLPAGIPVLPWWGLTVLLTAGAVFAGIGWFHLFKKDTSAAMIVLAAIGGTVLLLSGIRLANSFFYHRFIHSVSVPLILLVAIGLSRLRPPVASMGILAGFVMIVLPQIRLLLTRSHAPFRQSVEEMRALAQADRGSQNGPLLPAAYGLGSHLMQSYCPELRDIRTDPAAKLQSLIDQSRKENRPLLVALGYEALNRQNLPGGFPLLDDPSLFETVSTFHGIEPHFSIRVLRLKSAAP